MVVVGMRGRIERLRGGRYGGPIKRTRTGIGSDGRKDKSATGNLPNPVLRLLCFLPFMQSVKQVTDDR